MLSLLCCFRLCISILFNRNKRNVSTSVPNLVLFLIIWVILMIWWQCNLKRNKENCTERMNSSIVNMFRLRYSHKAHAMLLILALVEHLTWCIKHYSQVLSFLHLCSKQLLHARRVNALWHVLPSHGTE